MKYSKNNAKLDLHKTEYLEIFGIANYEYKVYFFHFRRF